MHHHDCVDILMFLLVLILFLVLIGVGWIIATSDLPPWFKFALLS